MPANQWPTWTNNKKNPGVSNELQNWLLDEENQPGSYAASSELIEESIPRQIGGHAFCCQTLPGCSWMKSRIFIRLLKFIAVFISGAFFALLVLPLVEGPVNDLYDNAFHGFRNSFDISPSSPDYPIDFFKSVLPVPCHSHNDYWRRRPFYSALGTGCISIETDIWLVNNDLYVGHSFEELDRKNTLRSMYIDPLINVLQQMNTQPLSSPTGQQSDSPRGVFYQEPTQTLTLLIDFKTIGSEIWPILQEQLAPLRDGGWLTYWDGKTRLVRPVTIVGTGNTPFDMLSSNHSYRDVFFDAPLATLNEFDEVPSGRDELGSSAINYVTKYNPDNSYYASSSLTQAVGPLFQFQLTEPQIELIRKQIRQARDRGLIPRYWGTPRWPRSLRDEVWEVLLREGVGVLNVDDLRAARKGTWGHWAQTGGL